MKNTLALNVVLTYPIVTWLVLLLIWDYLIYVHLYDNINNNLFHLNKLPGHKRSSPLLLSNLLRDRMGKNYTVCCKAYALSFIFARIFKDVLASCTLQSAILLRTARSIQQYGSTEWNWRDLVRELPEFVVIFEILPIQERMKEQRNCVLQISVRQVVALTTGMLRFKLTFSHIDYTRTRTLQMCFVLPNKIRIQFRFHSHSVIDRVKYCKLSSQARLML